MKTLLKNSLTFLLMLMPVLAFAQQAPQIMNVSARQTTSLDGQWKTIVDPFENGYYDYRLKPYDGGYAQDKTYSDKTKLQEYDFETDKLLFVPGDWNTQRPQLYYYEGTVWYRKHFEYSLQPGKRLFLNFGPARTKSRRIRPLPACVPWYSEASCILFRRSYYSRRCTHNPDLPGYPGQNNPEYKKTSYPRRMQALLPRRKSVLPDKLSSPTGL